MAFVAGLATSIGAAVSMGYSEALSDTGDLTRRGRPLTRGLITGAGTFLGGILHALPFLLPGFRVALVAAIAVVALELVAIALIRARYFEVDFRSSLGHIALAEPLSSRSPPRSASDHLDGRLRTQAITYSMCYCVAHGADRGSRAAAARQPLARTGRRR